MRSSPNEDDVSAAAEDVVGERPTRVTRFTTGSAHFVYEAAFADGHTIVIRMGAAARRDPLAEGLALQERLVAHGVPLPAILGHAFDTEWPFIAMERLAGKDLQYVINTLNPTQLDAIARRVAEAQAATATLGVGSRFGFAADGDAAPHERWSGTVGASLARSRRRLTANGIFEVESIMAPLERHLAQLRPLLDAVPATPFLHDTTTRNVIIDEDGQFSGIVDVDDLCFGDPRYAPALTWAVLAAYGGPLAYVEAWMEAAGHADDALFRFYVALFVADLMAEQGMVFNGNEGPTDPQRNRRLLDAFQQALAAITQQPGPRRPYSAR